MTKKKYSDAAEEVCRFEPGCGDIDNADAELSLAISAKRQADALERIANVLEKQTNIVSLLSDELRG